jgi:flagellar motor switch protein FliM
MPAGATVQALDFSQPTKFTTDLRRRITRLLGPFCKATSARMSAELRAPVELTQLEATQLSWSAAKSSLPEEAILAVVKAQPIGGHILLAVEQPLVLRSLDCMLGGSATSAPESRRLSDIDLALTKRLLSSIVLQLSMLWRDLAGQELSVGEVDAEGDAGMLMPISEPTFAIDFELSLAGFGSKLSLLIPWSAIEPVVGEILGGEGPLADADPRQTRALELGLATAKMLVRAEIGATTLPVEQVLAIAPGTLVTLKAKADQGVRLLADRVVLARGMPGRSGVCRAIKLTSPISPETDPAARPLPVAQAQAASSPAQTREALERLAQLRDVDLRLWAELGRTRMSLGSAMRLPEGAVLELDQGAEDPVELFVNGLRFASGTLLVTDEGEWAVQVSALG